MIVTIDGRWKSGIWPRQQPAAENEKYQLVQHTLLLARFICVVVRCLEIDVIMVVVPTSYSGVPSSVPPNPLCPPPIWTQARLGLGGIVSPPGGDLDGTPRILGRQVENAQGVLKNERWVLKNESLALLLVILFPANCSRIDPTTMASHKLRMPPAVVMSVPLH
eukprot:scaffold7802_cov71-Cyclotella_meneghiniana.AAC.21